MIATSSRSEEKKLTAGPPLQRNNLRQKLKQVSINFYFKLAAIDNRHPASDYRVHLVEKTHYNDDSDYDTDDLIEDARNFVITGKRYS